MTRKYDLVIIGAGSGGLGAATEASKFGLKTLLIEKNKLGGDCLWHGCIPSKTLIHEADKIRIIKEERMSGDAPINFAKHFEEAKTRIKMVQEMIANRDSVEKFKTLGVETKIGKALFYKKNKLKIEKEEGKEEYVKFKRCIIATGSRPMVPEIFANAKYFTSDNIFDIANLPQSMIVVGGGSVGVEIASAFAMFGTKIKVVLKEDRIMPKEEPEIAKFMKEKMQTLGIEFYENADIKEIYERKVEGKNLTHLDIGKGEVLQGEVLFVATGRSFNTDLDLQNAGVELGERKEIKINDYLQTTNKNIYAIGDVNGFRLFTHAAGYQSRAAISNILLSGFLVNIFGLAKFWKKKSAPLAFPWVTYTYPEVAHVGNYKKDLEDKKVFYKSYTTELESVDRAQTAKINKEGFIEVIVGKKGKILGVTIVSPHAGELITEWTLAMENNLPVEAIFNTVHAYPTLSELNPRGTFQYINEQQTPFKKKLAKFFFRF